MSNVAEYFDRDPRVTSLLSSRSHGSPCIIVACMVMLPRQTIEEYLLMQGESWSWLGMACWTVKNGGRLPLDGSAILISMCSRLSPGWMSGVLILAVQGNAGG